MADGAETPVVTARLAGAFGRVGRSLARTLRSIARHRLTRRGGLVVALLLVSLAGASLGLLLAGRTHHDVGPFSAQFTITPSVTGGTDIQIPPLGSLSLRSHAGPHLTVALQNLDQRRTLALADDPNGLSKASQSAVTDIEHGVTRLVLQAAGAAILGALVLGALVFRNGRRVAICGGLAVVAVLASGAVAVASFRPKSVEEPKYQGLLTNAPAVVGNARQIAGRFTAYRAELQRLVNNVTKLYSTYSTLPVYEPDPSTIRVLHISDLHLNPSAWPVIRTVAREFNVNIVIDTGDIDDWGTQVESSFADSIASLKVPYVFIRGNHDSQTTAQAVARQPNAKVLEDQIVTVDGLTIAGIGDPRFTPDKSTQTPNVVEQELLTTTGQSLRATIEKYDKPVNIALVHDPAEAQPLAGSVPLVLAGHIHHRETRTLAPAPALVPTSTSTSTSTPTSTQMPTSTPTPAGPATITSTRLMVEGSTGGAGLRGLEGEQPTPLEMTVLYFDSKQHNLQAYDEITLGGAGQTEVTLQRHIVGTSTTPAPTATPSSVQPTPSR